MVQSLGFLRSCALFYHYLSSVAAPAELTGGPLPPDQEFIQLTRYLSLPTTPRHLLNSDFSLALGRHQDHSVHRVVTSAFWRTFSHEGKIRLGW
jgi:hypothetical protein